MAEPSKPSRPGRAGTELNTSAPETWTQEALHQFMLSNRGQGTEGLFREVYGWSKEDLSKACSFVTTELEKHDWGTRFPTIGNKRYNERQEIERKCVNSQRALFCRRQDTPATERPTWYYPRLYIDGRAMASQKDSVDGFTIGYLFLAYCNSKLKKSDTAAKVQDDETQQKVLTEQAERRQRKTSRAPSTSSVGSQSTTAGVTRRLKRQRLSASATSTPNRRSRTVINVDDDADDTLMFDAPPEKPAIHDCIVIVAGVTPHGDDRAEIALQRAIGSELFDANRRVLKDEVRLLIPYGDKTARLFYFLSTEVIQEMCDSFGFATAALRLWQRLPDPSFMTIFVCTDIALIDRLPRKYHDLRWQNVLNTQCDLAEPDRDSDRVSIATERLPSQSPVQRALSPPVRGQSPLPLDASRSSSPIVETEEQRLAREQQAAELRKATEEDQARREQEAREAQQKQSSGGGITPDAYPFMVLPASNAVIKPVETDGVPPVRISGVYELEFMPYLSSPLSASAAGSLQETDTERLALASTELTAATAETGDWLEHQIKADHMSPNAWQDLCAFWDIDPTRTDPAVRAFYPGWNRTKALKMYQCHAVTWALKELFRGRKFIVVAAAMGMGKTAIALAICDISRLMQQLHGSGVAVEVPCIDPRLSAFKPKATDKIFGRQFDVERLVKGPITLHQGPTLIICPKNLEKGWINERQNFINSKGAPFIVVAREKNRWTAAERAASYSRCFHYTDYVDPTLWPRDEVMVEHYGEEKFREWKDRGKITVIDFLAPDRVGNPGRWQNHWWVITSSQSIGNRIKMAGERPRRDKIRACWSKVIIDEFDSCKTASAQPWLQVSDLPGNPAIIGLSATPFTRLRDISGAVIASHGCFFEALTREDSGITQTEMMKLGRAEYSQLNEEGEPRHLDFVEYVDDKAIREMIIKAGYFGVDEHAMAVDKTLKDTQEADSEVPADKEKRASKKSSEAEISVAVQSFADWIRQFMIKLPSSLLWQPDPSKPALPAVDIPSHAHFQIRYKLPDTHDAFVTRAWTELLSKITSSKEANRSMLSDMEKFKVYLVFPMLYDLRKQYTDLDVELGDMKVDEAKVIHALGKKSVLWRYMDSIHKSRGMELQCMLLQMLRAQMVTFGHGRKIIFAANKPFIAMVFNLYLEWLADTRRGGDLVVKDSFVFIPSFGDAKDKDKDKDKDAAFDMAAQFRSTNGEPGYEDKPYILVGVASQISVGLNLVPATVVIILDSNWEPSRDEQLTGRVQRSRDVQKADKTWSFQCVPLSTSCDLALRMASRSANKAQIRDMVIAAAKELARTRNPVNDDDEVGDVE